LFTWCLVHVFMLYVDQMGQTSHDAVPVPFVLPAGVSNEGQFAFTVESISQPTRLKGTLTYMVKVSVLLLYTRVYWNCNVQYCTRELDLKLNQYNV